MCTGSTSSAAGARGGGARERMIRIVGIPRKERQRMAQIRKMYESRRNGR